MWLCAIACFAATVYLTMIVIEEYIEFREQMTLAKNAILTNQCDFSNFVRVVCKNNLKMGSEESKAHVEHNGDSHIDIINMQSEHSEKFEENKLMLQIIQAIVAVQFAITMYNTVKKYIQKKTQKKAEELASVAARS